MVKVLLMQIYITFHEPGVQLFLGGQSIQCSMKNEKIGYMSVHATKWDCTRYQPD